MAKKSMRGNVGAIIAGGVAVAGVAALWYWWWVWYQEKQADAEGDDDDAPKQRQQLAGTVDETPDDETADPDTGGVGFWGNPLPEPQKVNLGG